MQISFNPTSLVENSVINSQVDFIEKYGNYSSNYKDLTPLGGQKKIWFYFIVILSLILTTILFYMSKEEKDINGNIIQPTNTKKLYKTLAWVFLGIFIVSITYSGYMYFFVYSPQYNEWLNSLPVDARNKLNIIRGLNMIANQAQSYNMNNPGLINIS